MFSIDQNSHSLWDALPKLQAVARRGRRVRHFIEDIDVAFTSAGADAESSGLLLAREQFHRGGIADWGAAMFYSEFLGRLPVDIAGWETLTGIKTAALARQLGRSVEELYDEFSRSDNWQLIGPSYFQDRDHHRLIGDLTVAEAEPFLRQLLVKARADCMSAFPQADSQRRLTEWFDREEKLVDRILHDCAAIKLVDVYQRWLASYLDDRVTLGLTSSLFACGADEARTAVMEAFLAHYDLAAGLYNEALVETSVHLRPLDTAQGELPFFAAMEHEGHFVRAAVYLKDGKIRISERTFKPISHGRLPLDELASAGVRCLAGKAILLVIQARLGPSGGELVLPYRGSPYVPAAQRLAQKLAAAGLLSGTLRPIVRVRFHLLDRMKELQTVIRLPPHLAQSLGRSEVPACLLGATYASIAQEAARHLERFANQEARDQWCGQTFPDVVRNIDLLEQRRRELAKTNPKSEEIRHLGQEQKQLRNRLTMELLRQIDRDAQTAQIEYWDSRGAILPWCIALGGQSLYDSVIDGAEIGPEPPQEAQT